MSKLNKIFLIIILTVFTNCQYDPYADKYTTSEPKNEELLGSYYLEKESTIYNDPEFENLLKYNFLIPEIEIKNDGTYFVNNFPIFKSWETEFSGLITMSGKWNKRIVGTVDLGNEEKKFWGINLEGLEQEFQRISLMNNKFPYEIIFGFGDPDEGKSIIFKRK